jgi:serine phosphatase RsbU (regulator of sigma subunit)
LLLERGDSLLLFTDGALIQANQQGEPLGESDFAQLVQSMPEPKLDVGRIEKRLLESGQGLRDDLTLLSIQLA